MNIFFLKLLSYLYPISRKKILTQKNGQVKIVLNNGKKHLDSKNANYSYGSLERTLNFGLNQINLKDTKNILLLGLGGGSVIKVLRNKFKYNNKIVAVDFDKTIIEIAKNEFDINETDNLNIILSDCIKHLEQNTDTFDLIIIDIFIDNIIPDFIFEIYFWDKIKNTLSEKGKFIFNAGINKLHKNQVENITNTISNWASIEIFERVETTNTVIIGKKYDIIN